MIQAAGRPAGLRRRGRNPLRRGRRRALRRHHRRRVRVGPGKLRAVRDWAERHRVALGDSWAYSDSYYDALWVVGHPVAVNPDPHAGRGAGPPLAGRAPRRSRRRAQAALLGIEPQRLLQMLAWPELLPWVRFDIDGVERIPAAGPPSWRPTTAATSTRWRWAWRWPAGVGRCASWASGRSSTPRSSAPGSGHGRHQGRALDRVGPAVGRGGGGPRRGRVGGDPPGDHPRGPAFFDPS